MSDARVVELQSRFQERFGHAPRIFRAPGRVNLIGEHTDYNEGWVMPAAITFSTLVAIAPTPDPSIRVVSVNFNEEAEFPLGSSASPAKNWSDYIRGVAIALSDSGVGLSGANMMVWGDVPLGAGLSSSASVEVASALAMLANSNAEIPRMELAKLCQRAENTFVGAKCGIMDQFISIHGLAGDAIMLDCRSLEFDSVPLPSGVSIVVCNTMVKHQLSAGEYNTRRAECESGVAALRQRFGSIESLRDASLRMIEQHRANLPDNVYRRCRHVVTENQRVLEFAQALRRIDLARAGELMRASHVSLRDDYEVSCPELDTMVELAYQQPGTIGSRMTGGGFGGCTVSLVRTEAVQSFQEEVAKGYKARTGIDPEIYATGASGGASEVEI